MKKKYIILSLMLLLIPLNVFAAGGFSVSPGSISMYPGESKTITITSNNSVGKLNVSSSNSGVAGVSPGSIFVQTPGSSVTITVTANAVGTSTISVVASENYATMEEEYLTGQTKTVTVNVVEKPAPPANNSGNNNTSNNSSSNQSNNQTNNKNSSKSTNNRLKEITVDGYNLEKADDNNYTLSVGKDVDSINISAIAEDNKSTITGAGEHKLVAGENEIEIVVTSESGAQNKITIKVTKKDEYSIEDLKTLLSDPKVNEIDITIDSDSRLSSQDISEIKTSNKVVNLNYYDKDKKLIYSWILDGSQIEDFDNLQTSIELESKNKKEMSKLSNYAEGLYISLNHNGIIPKGTKIRLYVGDKYDNNDLLNVYYYNNDSLIKIASDLKVDNGYITFEAEKTSDYLITMSDIKNEEKITSRKITLKHILLTIGLLLLLLILCIILFIKKRKNRKKTNSLNNFNNQTYNFNDNK